MASVQILVSLGLLGLAASSSVGRLDVCAKFSWPTGVYPHPTDCTQFIQCSNGITNEIDCPNGTLFNPILRVCDNPVNVPICQSSVVDVADACNLFSWTNGIHFHPYDCTKYIECTYGRTDIMACAPGLYYDPAVETCNRATSNPYCTQYVTAAPVPVATDAPVPVATDAPATDAPATDAPVPAYPAGWDTYCADNKLLTGIHPDPYSCLHFIECTFGRTTHMACPAGTAFNSNLLVCDDNMKVDCKVNLPVGK